jgi:glucosylglycerate synthase
MTRFNTALRFDAKKRIEQIEGVDIVVGIPCFNNEVTVGYVIGAASQGIAQFFPGCRGIVLVSDGGSTDDTREAALAAEIAPGIERLVTIYRGPSGKGSAFRAIFEAVVDLEARACVVCDSDLRSIRPDWIHHLADPVFNRDYEYVTPLYSRYKYDGTITNNLVYSLTRALFGVRLRQPIGGDFGFSRSLARHYLDQSVWASEVARFGIDIWMTITAVTQGLRICQARLGAKVHDPKDPAASLAPMFREVIYTLFQLVDQHEPFWKEIHGSRTTEIFGSRAKEEPEPIKVDTGALIEEFRSGYRNFAPLWQRIVNEASFNELGHAYSVDNSEFRLRPETWVKIVYDFVGAFHKQKRHRRELIEMMCPIYFARVASFVLATQGWPHEEAEEDVERMAELFEQLRPYLEERWKAPRVLPLDLLEATPR